MRLFETLLQRDCALTSGYSVGNCDKGIGGAREFYIAAKSSVATITIAAGVITAITNATGKRWWHYITEVGVTSAKEELQSNVQNGTLYWNQTVTFAYNRLDSAKRSEIVLLGQNLLLTIVKDRNGKAWLYGYDGGLNMTAGNAGTGTAEGDRNGYDLTFTGQEPVLAYEVNSSVLAGLETPGT